MLHEAQFTLDSFDYYILYFSQPFVRGKANWFIYQCMYLERTDVFLTCHP